MVDLYVLMIQKGLKKIEDVPLTIRDEVHAKLDEMA